MREMRVASDPAYKVSSLSIMEALKSWRLSLPEGFRTLEKAGRLLGVSGVQMYRYENGLRRVPPEKAKAFAAIIGCDPAVLRPDVFGPARPLKTRSGNASVG